MRYIYDHGLPFSATLAPNLDDLMSRVEGNKASMIIIDGGVGEGKTTLGVHLGDYVHRKKGLELMDLGKQIGLGGEDFLGKMRESYHLKLPVLMYDEAGDFNRRGSLTRFNAMLNRTFETFRAFQIIVILALPSFSVLDQDLFDKCIPRMLIHCEGRTNSEGNYRVYSLKQMHYLRHYMKKTIIKSNAYRFTQPNLFGHFLNLPPERARALDNISTANKLKTVKKAEIKIQGLVSYSDICKKLYRSLSWTSKAMNKLKIKPVKRIEKVKYFNEKVIDRLQDYIDELADKGKGRG